MEHFILNRKIVATEKNKDFSLPIPVLFNAATAEFILEIPEEQIHEGIFLELSAYRSAGKESTTKIQVELNSPTVRFRFSDYVEVEPKDYLLYSCRSNRSVRLSMSVIARD